MPEYHDFPRYMPAEGESPAFFEFHAAVEAIRRLGMEDEAIHLLSRPAGEPVELSVVPAEDLPF